MTDIDPQKDESQKEKNEIEEKEDKKESEKAEEIKEEEKKDEKKEEKEDEKEEDKKEDEDEKSEEEKEKSESSKDSDVESEESKNSKESKESKESNEDKKSKDKKEKDEEENEEDDDDDDDIDDDVDDEGNSDESSSENKQKDPYHGYMNSKTEYKSFVNDIKKNDYVYGFKQNKFYKLIDLKDIANDKKAHLYKFELKEIKNDGEGGKKINVKLAKNIQYMASIYGKAQEEEKEKEKEKDAKEKEKKENKNKDKDKEEKNSENDIKKENSNTIEENKDKNIEKENKSDEKEKKVENKDNIQEENKKDNIEENENKIEEKKESEKQEEENKEEIKEENKEENKDKEKPKEKKEKDTKKKDNKKKVKNLNLFAVIKDITEYTFFQKIRVIYLNPLNNPVVFYLKINMNTSIKEIIDQFADLYHYKHERYSDNKIPLHIFINGKKHSISNKTQAKYFIPTKFDYKNDYILILEKQLFKLKELDVGSRTNYLNLKGINVVHAVYNSLYNYEVDSFLITKGITSLDCQVYELKKELNIRQYTDNEHTIKQKLREFLDSNWKEKTNLVTTFKSIKVKNSKSYNCNLFEISRKFILLQGKIYVFVIKSNNKKLDVFNGRRIYTDGIYIVSKNNKSILDGFRAKAISDFTANS